MDSTDTTAPGSAAQDSTETYIIDLSGVQDKADLHELLAHSLPLPPYYGRNLDALYDCLTGPHRTWNITFTGCEAAEHALKSYFTGFKETFADAEELTDSVQAAFL